MKIEQLCIRDLLLIVINVTYGNIDYSGFIIFDR